MEDVTDIILNVKSLIVKLDADEPKEMRVTAKKAGPVTAGMIEADPAITVVNKDLVIATLTEDVNFEMTLTVGKGRGYVTALENIAKDIDEQEIGLIAVDSIYSPVTRVRYATEDARVGQKTDYDRLILEIWTNGTITPEMALVEASKILRKHLNPFVQYFELGSATPPATTRSPRCATPTGHDRSGASAEAEHDGAGAGPVGAGEQLPGERQDQHVRDLVKKTDRTC
jgi:DNA-directed RNA polymerase subunit alpha